MIRRMYYGKLNKGVENEVEFLDYQLKENNNMQGIFKLDWANCKSALVYGILWGILVMAIYAYQVGDLWKLDFHNLVNTGIFAFLGTVVSLLKNLLTNNKGQFIGKFDVVSDKVV